MGRIAVFDSGLGSLSLIGPIKMATKADIVYLADLRSYPYGTKTRKELLGAVKASISTLCERFDPDVIVMGSNTPSLLVPEVLGRRVIGVLPPVRRAARTSKTRNIAVLATRSASRSIQLKDHIAKQTANTQCNVKRVDATDLIDLVQTTKFVTKPTMCAKVVQKTLGNIFLHNSIDTATLSSTHLPLLLPVLTRVFPNVTFIDPARDVASRAARLAAPNSKRSTLRVYATGRAALLEKQLARMGYPYTVSKI